MKNKLESVGGYLKEMYVEFHSTSKKLIQRNQMSFHNFSWNLHFVASTLNIAEYSCSSCN